MTINCRSFLAGTGGLGDCRFLLRLAGEKHGFAVNSEGLHSEPETGLNSSWDFDITLDAAVWQAMCASPAPRGFTSAQAVVATVGEEVIRGDRQTWARYAVVVDRVVAGVRDRVRGGAAPRHPEPPRRAAGLSPITGRYLTVDVEGSSRRLYFEESGHGQPVLCLHTAGADSRQFRYLLENQQLLERYRFIAFDMPWHGRSEPPDDWSSTRYSRPDGIDDANQCAETHHDGQARERPGVPDDHDGDPEHVAERGAQRQGRRHFVDDRTQEIWPVAHRSPSPSKQIQLVGYPFHCPRLLSYRLAGARWWRGG